MFLDEIGKIKSNRIESGVTNYRCYSCSSFFPLFFSSFLSLSLLSFLSRKPGIPERRGLKSADTVV